MNLRKCWYVVLFCFSFLLIPKDYWHHCEEDHQHHSDTELSFKKSDLDCDICDFELFQLNQIEPKTSIFLTFYQESKIDLIQNTRNSLASNKFNKGPPQQV